MDRVADILKILELSFPAQTALLFRTPFELLIATMLSAQTTDRQVNRITPKLFALFPTVDEIALLRPAELEPLIHSCGLYRAKASHIVATCQLLQQNFGGNVPNTMEELVTLPGVGRKTANVVLSNAYHIPALAVDTHVFRVSRRLGLTRGKNVLIVEQDLMQLIPRNLWGSAHHWLIGLGRTYCHARCPDCYNCPLHSLCPFRPEVDPSH